MDTCKNEPVLNTYEVEYCWSGISVGPEEPYVVQAMSSQEAVDSTRKHHQGKIFVTGVRMIMEDWE